jgi:hypothetical protein
MSIKKATSSRSPGSTNCGGETYLPVALYGQVAEGDVATVEPEAPIGDSDRAKVAVLLPNPGLRLPSGMRCKVRFQLSPSLNAGLRAEARERF